MDLEDQLASVKSVSGELSIFTHPEAKEVEEEVEKEVEIEARSKERVELPSIQTRFGMKKEEKQKKRKKPRKKPSKTVPERIEHQALQRSYGDTSVLKQSEKILKSQATH